MVMMRVVAMMIIGRVGSIFFGSERIAMMSGSIMQQMQWIVGRPPFIISNANHNLFLQHSSTTIQQILGWHGRWQPQHIIISSISIRRMKRYHRSQYSCIIIVVSTTTTVVVVVPIILRGFRYSQLSLFFLFRLITVDCFRRRLQSTC